jgi:hypothetical protein
MAVKKSAKKFKGFAPPSIAEAGISETDKRTGARTIRMAFVEPCERAFVTPA